MAGKLWKCLWRFRIWIVISVAAVVAWGIVYLFCPSAAKLTGLVVLTYIESPPMIPAWRVFGYSPFAAMLIVTALGDASAATQWFASYLNWERYLFTKRLRFLFPSQRPLMWGSASWPRYANSTLVVIVMLFFGILPGLVLARTTREKKWTAFVMVIFASTARNASLGVFLPRYSLLNQFLVSGIFLTVTTTIAAYVHRRQAREPLPRALPELIGEE